MNKTIDFELNKFSTVPNRLREAPSVDKADTEFDVELARLYHHYYTDSYGTNPPDPDHTNFEYLKFLAPSSDFRFFGAGPSASTGKKRAISNELGQAFCRYFLYEYCGVSYFAHMDKVLNKKTHPAFDGLTITRGTKGDVPDYLCARKVNQPYIGEAKGRFDSISFSSLDFSEWRNQFTRIVVKDKHGISKKVKGYIVATKYTTEKNRATNKAKLFAEDPETDGDDFIGDNSIGLGRGCISIHYSRLISKLGLSLWSQSLEDGFIIPEQITFNLPVWRCHFPPLSGKLFVGGFFSEVEPIMTETKDKTYIFQPNILKLGYPSPAFYGISVPVMKLLRQVSLGNWQLLSEMPELPDTEFRPSNIAWLRDGSITGPLDFFEYLGLFPF